MQSFELTISHNVTIAFTFTVRARNRRDAEERFGRMIDAGRMTGHMNVETSVGGEVLWKGDPVMRMRPKHRRRRGKAS